MWKKVIEIIVLVILGFSVTALAQEENDRSVDYSSAPVQAFLSLQDSLKGSDLQRTWKHWSKLTQDEQFGSFENYRVWADGHQENREAIIGAKVKNVKYLTPTRVLIELESSFSQIKGLYLVDGEEGWKFVNVQAYNKKVLKDLEFLAEAINNYYADNDVFPDDLTYLAPAYIDSIPIDPFTDEGKPYIYKIIDDKPEIYSVGPDGEDDLGEVEYVFDEDIVSDGDIIKKFY